MPLGRLIVVDTSVWIDYFRRGTSTAAQRLEKLLHEEVVFLTPVIRAELLSGTPTQQAYDLLKDRLSVIPLLEGPSHLWDLVAQGRFRLARKGIQASLIDVSIAVVARHHRCALYSLDKDFSQISKVLPLNLLS